VYGVAKGDRDGFLGAVDITLYPVQVREALEQLRENEISRPIKVGDRYVIYKRFSDNIVRSLP
jgi:parvulin-like peptidyl-prolyl isomerase